MALYKQEENRCVQFEFKTFYMPVCNYKLVIAAGSEQNEILIEFMRLKLHFHK